MVIAANGGKIKPDSILKRRQEQIFSEIDGEVVMLSLENSEYYGMDKVGSRIWQLLENPVSLREIIEALLEEYDVTEGQCADDTIKFVEQLADKNLIEITGS